jgi:peptidoglycan/xylan/chitin deacetylase (PgdA/CDA1 family)
MHSKDSYRVLLSFDLEEFDLPNEYGAALPMSRQLAVTAQGMEILEPALSGLALSATFFTTAFYAQQHPAQLQQLAGKHEIASHTFHHSSFTEDDIGHSRQILSAISGQAITGFRMPRLAPVSKALIAAAGYRYDASLNPTWLPGRYNHLSGSRTIYREGDLWIVPSSVTPRLRIPLFWLAFKNLPLWFIKKCSLDVLQKDGYLSLYFHPWEFAPLGDFKDTPFYIRRLCGQPMLKKLVAYLAWLKTIALFETMDSFTRRREAATPAPPPTGNRG